MAATDVFIIMYENASNCPHVCRSSFIFCPTHESFGYYDLLLSIVQGDLAKSGRNLQGLMLDTCCRYCPHAKRDLPSWAGDGFIYNVGSLHSKAGHKLECQLAFSSMYTEGSGRCIGESMEQLWVSVFMVAIVYARIVGPTVYGVHMACKRLNLTSS